MEDLTVRLKAAAHQANKRSIMPKVSALTLAIGLLALAGCGSSSSNTSSSASTPTSAAATPTTSSAAASSTPAPAAAGGGQSLSLEANSEGQLKYNTTSLTAAKAGAVSIAFTNMASLGHNVTVASSSGAVVGATPTFSGGEKTLSLNLKPGTYKFYCSVPGHRMAGMEGTLTVK
jgi:plastocyanin